MGIALADCEKKGFDDPGTLAAIFVYNGLRLQM